MRVKFSDPDEFLAELESDAHIGAVDRKILRVTCRFSRTPPTTAVTVIGSYSVGSIPTVLEHHVGSYLSFEMDGKEIAKQADRVSGRLADEAKNLGLTVRAGVIEA